ncbi:hypothetical protein H0H87_009686, partial [Tephrocybe sp. NHM501043]
MSNLVQLKPEAPEAQVSRKRHSDIAFGPTNGVNAFERTLSPTIDKRRKVEEHPAALNLRAHPPSSQPMPAAIENNRIKVQGEIVHQENILNPTKNDLGDMDLVQTTLSSCRRRKDELGASTPNASPIQRTILRPQFPVLPASPLQDDKDGVLLQMNTFHHQADPHYQPCASGSNVHLSGTYEDNENMVIDRPAYKLHNAEIFDDHGDFFGRGRDTFVGPQAKADDINRFLLEAGNAEQFDGNAKIDQALEKLGLKTQYDLLPGLEVALMPHQTVGVSWMVDKEKSSFKGGCLADDMGLGKTVQMIATLIKNRSENPMCKTNLIIAPTALLNQWKREIEYKTNCNLQCLIYHGPTKPRTKDDLLRYDVILTTYSVRVVVVSIRRCVDWLKTMALEWPDYENEMKKKAKATKKKMNSFIVDDLDEDIKPKARREKGLLFQVEVGIDICANLFPELNMLQFWRIILDEAQSIRNRRTRTSRAVTELVSTYRWCLTGTPIVNGLTDAYGYLRFLKVRPWYDFQDFQNHVGILEKKNPSLAVTRLQTILGTFLLRRMKTTLMDGKRLIELPEKTVNLIKLQFSDEERDVYKMVEAQAQVNFNRFLRAGTVLKNYHQVLVLLLRLRQICSHPSLIQEGGSGLTSPNEAEEDGSSFNGELARARKLVSTEFVTKMKATFKASALQRMEVERNSVDVSAEDEECPICFDVLTDAVVTPCTHVFCRECLTDVLNTPEIHIPDYPNKYKANERPCPSCRSAVCEEKLFSRAAFLPSDAELSTETGDIGVKVDASMSSDIKGRGKPKGKAVKLDHFDANSDEDYDDDMLDFIVEDEEEKEEKDSRRMSKKLLDKRKAIDMLDSNDEETPEEKEIFFGRRVPALPEAIKLMPKFLPSTKMKCMMERLNQLVEERPDEKTLIVSQWTSCLSLVSKYLTEKGIIHVKYQGDMNRVKRDQAVRVFMAKDKARVMLMSLKCGGKSICVGLNLTRANNVISLDLGWSHAIEAQSFDR